MTVPSTPPSGIRHVIVDRDGVLNREAPAGGWITRPQEWTWETGALEGLRLLAAADLRISVATNQSGVGRRVMGRDAVDAVHDLMIREAATAGARIDAVFVCPHPPDGGCDCRKPAPGLIRRAMAAARVPASQTVVIGDALSDLEAAWAAGAAATLVRTGKGRAAEARLGDREVPVYDDLQSAAAALVARLSGSSEMSIRTAFDEHQRVFAAARDALPEVLGQVVQAALRCLRAGGKLLLCGNGGSAADAQHLAAELVCRFRHDRRALPAVALTANTSAVTAIANDYGYRRVFARQVEALARPGDLLVAISTSGSSENVVAAAQEARERGCSVVALTGRDGGCLAAHADLWVAVPSATVARIQEMHSLCLHVLAEALEESVREETR